MRVSASRAAGLGVLRGHLVATVVAGTDARDRGHRVDDRAARLGEVQVVLGQRVLGVVAAAGHALAAVPAGAARRAGTTEVRVRDLVAVGLAGAAEEHADRGRVPRVADPHVVGDLLHHLVGRGHDRVVDDAEHPLRLVVVRRQLLAPVGDVAPLRVVVERCERLVERVRVDQRAATDARTGEDQAVLEGVDPLDAVAADLGPEEVVPEVPRGVGEVAVLEPAAGLEHRHPVALLGEPQSADRSAEARADDQDVVVERPVRRPVVERPSPVVERPSPVVEPVETLTGDRSS